MPADLQGADPNIYVVPARGGPARLITSIESQDHPDWSPDGRLIAYSWGKGLGADDTRVIRPDGTGDAAASGRSRPTGAGYAKSRRGPPSPDLDPSWQPR